MLPYVLTPLYLSLYMTYFTPLSHSFSRLPPSSLLLVIFLVLLLITFLFLLILLVSCPCHMHFLPSLELPCIFRLMHISGLRSYASLYTLVCVWLYYICLPSPYIYQLLFLSLSLCLAINLYVWLCNCPCIHISI